MSHPYREPVLTCKPNTFKYFFEEDKVFDVWESLEAKYGAIQATNVVIEIQSKPFLLRSSIDGGPIIVIRNRRCKPKDVEELHRIIGYTESEQH